MISNRFSYFPNKINKLLLIRRKCDHNRKNAQDYSNTSTSYNPNATRKTKQKPHPTIMSPSPWILIRPHRRSSTTILKIMKISSDKQPTNCQKGILATTTPIFASAKSAHAEDISAKCMSSNRISPKRPFIRKASIPKKPNKASLSLPKNTINSKDHILAWAPLILKDSQEETEIK